MSKALRLVQITVEHQDCPFFIYRATLTLYNLSNKKANKQTKDPEGWSSRGLNLQPPAQQTGTLPNEPTRWWLSCRVRRKSVLQPAIRASCT